MAEVKDVTILIVPGSSIGKQKVTVGFTLVFSAAEAGQKFRYAITLHGQDKPGDDPEPFHDGALLYTFTFPAPVGAFTSVPYKWITAVAGSKTFTHPNEVSNLTLNEDPGHGSNPQTSQPHRDEVYATVTLSQEGKSLPNQPSVAF